MLFQFTWLFYDEAELTKKAFLNPYTNARKGDSTHNFMVPNISFLFEIWSDDHPFAIIQNQTLEKVWFCSISNEWHSVQISNSTE